MFKKIWLGIAAILLLTACKSSTIHQQEQFDIQGHRGCRGLMPENSLQGMTKAIDLGVTTLEMDAVITKDKKVILSHEPYMSSNICFDEKGKDIKKAKEKSFNIYQMTYEEVQQFDCMSKLNTQYPQQKKFIGSKPLLEEVISEVEDYVTEHQLPKIQYNIEIKSTYQTDDTFHPSPKEYAELLIDILKKERVLNRTIIQSFDFRALRAVYEIDPTIKTAQLTVNQLSYKHNLQKLGFKPTIYSPYHLLVTEKMIAYLHEQKIKIIPWTVNKAERMEKLYNMGVDGIITDYPNLLQEIVNKQ